jgi:ATP-binding cassette, subfamily C, bacterial LapB
MDARPKTVGTFAGQVRQFELVRNFMTSSTLFLLADAPFVLFFIAIIAWVGGVIALIPIALLPLALLAGMYAQWRIKGLAEDQLNEINQKNGVLIEAIDGIEAVKAVGGEWKLLDRWQNLTAEAATRELRIRATTMMANNLGQTLQQASYVLLIATGAYAINAGQLTMGGLIACAIISNRALTPIAQISGLFVQWQHAKAALKGLDHMMSLPTDRDGTTRMVIPESCRGEIRLEEASFSYEESRVALQATNLHIRPGERIAIIGPVGAGKSTLIKILTGMYRPSEGRAFMDGVDMAHIAPEFLRENIGYLTQDVRLFNGTLRDNLTLGLPSPTDGQILSAARKTGLERLITAHPLGLELPIAEGGRGLSGGQRQLVGLTRLLLANPRILLLDEPTASMDSELESFVMMNLFRATPPDTVIVLATHKRGLLKLVDRIIIVDQNRIVHDGRRDDVLRLMMAARKKQMGQAPSPSPGQVTEEEL